MHVLIVMLGWLLLAAGWCLAGDRVFRLASRAWRPPRLKLELRELLALLFAWLFGMNVLALVAVKGVGDPQPTIQFPYLAIGQLATATLLFVLTVKVARATTSRLGLRPTRAMAGALAGVAYLLAWGPLVVVLSTLCRTIAPQSTPHPVQSFLLEHHSLWEWFWVWICVAVAAPLLEEFVFRGLLLPVLARHWGWAAGIVSSALAFGFLHWPSWPDPIPLTVLGVALGLARVRTQTLWAPISMHASFNGGMLLVGLLEAPARG